MIEIEWIVLNKVIKGNKDNINDYLKFEVLMLYYFFFLFQINIFSIVLKSFKFLIKVLKIGLEYWKMRLKYREKKLVKKI